VFSLETVMQRIGILFSVVAIFLIGSVQAQTRTGNADAPSRFPKVTIASSELRTIKSTSTGRDYDLYIHIPKQYDKDQTAKYPVLYVLDGQWEFKLVDQVVGGLVYDQYMPDVIIVGITYSGENADYDGLRAMDFTPTPIEELKGSGDGPKFLKFLKTELIPFVEASYRVDPTRRVLMGGSFGGLFALYAMFSDPSLFSAYLAACPAVVLGPFFKQEADYARVHKDLPVKLYVAVGGWDELSGPVQEFVHIVRSRNYGGLQLEARVIEGERHAGIAPEAFNRGLRFLFSEPVAQP
jgi:predicted alpha/beta superfamily hydrolase